MHSEFQLRYLQRKKQLENLAVQVVGEFSASVELANGPTVLREIERVAYLFCFFRQSSIVTFVHATRS